MSEHPRDRLQIGEVAERTGMSLRTLRHYDDIGLVTPSERSDGGFRLYTADDLARLLVIRRMKPLGYSLDDMHHVIGLLHAVGTPDRTAWEALLAGAEERRDELTRQVQMADEFIGLLRDQFRHMAT